MMRLFDINSGDTIADVLKRNKRIGPGFDLMRIVLAVCIFYVHVRWLAGGQSAGFDAGAAGQAAAQGAMATPTTLAPVHGASGFVLNWSKPFKLVLVPVFFALSGFLVTGSAVRLKRTSTFLANRGLRIFPALAMEVALSAFVIGSALTTLPLAEYVSDPQFARYLLNAVGHITFSLPGVFDQARVTHVVNITLWTLPAEFYCYIIMAILMITRLAYRRTALTIIVLLLVLALSLLNLRYDLSQPAGRPHTSHVIVLYFLVGMLAFHWQERIKLRIDVFLACSVVAFFALMSYAFAYVAILPLTYCAVFVGMLKFPQFKILKSGDYSYGVYLYGFPITQTVLIIFPRLFGHQYALFVVAGLLTCGFAAGSWHLVEKHALKLKRTLPERWFPTTPAERIGAEMARSSSLI